MALDPSAILTPTELADLQAAATAVHIAAANAVVAQLRGGAQIAVRAVGFSFGITGSSVPAEDSLGPWGPTERAEAVDTPDADWRRGDVLQILSFVGHTDATGNPLLPEITGYEVMGVRRIPGAAPAVLLTLTGQVTTIG